MVKIVLVSSSSTPIGTPKRKSLVNSLIFDRGLERKVASSFRAQEWIRDAKMQNVFRKINGCVQEQKPLNLTTIGINRTPYRRLLEEETMVKNEKSCNLII